MSTPADQLRLQFGPEAAHTLQVSTHFAHASFATTPESANIDLRLGVLKEDFDYQALDIQHYFLLEEAKRLPVSDTFSILESFVDERHNFRGVNPLPHTSELEVRGRVLTEATPDKRFHRVATSILRLTPVERQNNRMSTELVIIGDEPIERLDEILTHHLGDNTYHKPAKMVLRGLSYMRDYNHQRLSKNSKTASHA